jgi:hypothetical protein
VLTLAAIVLDAQPYALVREHFVAPRLQFAIQIFILCPITGREIFRF